MRIVCQNCSAAYAIDDKFVTPKGVRAQCPRCRHLQMVKKDEAVPSAASPAAVPGDRPAAGVDSALQFDVGGAPSNPFDFDLGAPVGRSPAGLDFSALAPPPAASTAKAQDAVFNFDLSPSAPAPAPPPAPLAAAPPAQAPAAFAPPPAGFELPAPNYSAQAVTSPPPSFGAFDIQGLQPPPAASQAPAADASPASATTCKSCGKSISDPFDVALGTCDECRSQQLENSSGSFDVVDAGKFQRVDVSDIADSANRSRARIAGAAEKAPAPGPSSASVEFIPALSVRPSTAGGGEGSSRSKMVFLAVGLAAVGGAAGLLVWKKPWVRKPPKLTASAPAETTKAILEIVKRWEQKYPELADEGASEAKHHAERGEELLQKDTTASYREAEKEFEKSLVLDSSNDRAIAGWALAIAFGRGGDVDELTSRAADQMLGAAEQRSGAPRLYVAHAHLDIARGLNFNDVQHRAEIGRNSQDARDKALAMLAIGIAQLQKNAQSSEKLFAEAIALDPKLKRALLFQAQLAMSVGKYKQAFESLEKRLALDPDQWEASELLARLLTEGGEVAKAEKVLKDAKAASAENVRVRIGLAMLRYQHQSDAAGAQDILNGVVADGDVSKKDRADALTHLAAIARVQGDLDKAIEVSEQAIELQPDHVPAKIQQLVASLDKGVASQARLTFDSVKGKLPSALARVLEGRLFFLENRLAEAVTMLSAVGDEERAYPSATLLAGAAAAKLRKDGKAWELCLKRGLKGDPLANSLPAFTHFYIRQGDLLKPAYGAWQALAAESDDPNVFLCEGLVSWLSQDAGSAEKAFARVTNIDPRNSDGFAMRSFVALKKGDLGSAVAHGQKAVAAHKTSGLARAALASALLGANKLDQAQVEANEANRLSPKLLVPRLVLAEIEARRKHLTEARELFVGILLVDPQYREAKRALFKHGL